VHVKIVTFLITGALTLMGAAGAVAQDATQKPKVCLPIWVYPS